MLLKLVFLVTLSSAFGALLPAYPYTSSVLARLQWPYSSYYYANRVANLAASKGYVAPVVSSKGSVAAPVVTSKGYVAPVVTSKGYVAPLVTSKGAKGYVAPLVTSKGYVSSLVTSKGAKGYVAPLVTSKGYVSSLVTSKGAKGYVAPLITSKGGVVSPYMVSSKGSAARVLMTTAAGLRYAYPAICSLPMEKGICSLDFQRYYYNKETGQCEEFSYGGCGKNANNFFTMAACRATCGAMPLLAEAPAPLCMRPPVEGACKDFSARYYYNADVGSCMMFVYSGCGSNGNNFETKDECEKLCPNVPVCERSKQAGPCLAALPRYHYNQETESCELFMWGGCYSNGNNFLSKFGCELQCKAPAKDEEVEGEEESEE